MLPARSRLRDHQLATTVKRGTRVGRRYLIVHFMAASGSSDEEPKVAFAVSKSVGGSVVRHRVVRRLRHVVASHLRDLPAGSCVVVRALPAAAAASSADLDRDLSALFSRVVVL